MVLTVYVVVAWTVLGVTDWLRRVLALPELFDTLLRGGMVVGLPVAALLAWKYPVLGHGGAVPALPGEVGPEVQQEPALRTGPALRKESEVRKDPEVRKGWNGGGGPDDGRGE
jgi:hypothetical protein